MIASEISKGSTRRKNSSNPKERFHPNHLRLKLITHDNPQRLLVVSSPCDCTKKRTLAVAHFETQKAKRNVNHVWLDATPSLVQRMRWWKFHVKSAATLQSVSETSLQPPRRDWSSVMGTKWSISNASRKLAAVVKEFVGWKGPCLCLGKSCFWRRGSSRGCPLSHAPKFLSLVNEFRHSSKNSW